jgi:hypothetical protein
MSKLKNIIDSIKHFLSTIFAHDSELEKITRAALNIAQKLLVILETGIIDSLLPESLRAELPGIEKAVGNALNIAIGVNDLITKQDNETENEYIDRLLAELLVKLKDVAASDKKKVVGEFAANVTAELHGQQLPPHFYDSLVKLTNVA